MEESLVFISCQIDRGADILIDRFLLLQLRLLLLLLLSTECRAIPGSGLCGVCATLRGLTRGGL